MIYHDTCDIFNFSMGRESLPKPNVLERFRFTRIDSMPDDGTCLDVLWYQVLWQNSVPLKFLKRGDRVEIHGPSRLKRDVLGLTDRVQNFHPDYAVLRLAYQGIGCDTIEKIIEGDVRNPEVWAQVPLSFYDFKWQFDENFLGRSYALAASRNKGKNAQHFQEKAVTFKIEPFSDDEIIGILNSIFLRITRDFENLPLCLKDRLEGNSLIKSGLNL